ncbi:MAG: redoxin domain-containing protein [Nitrososphaerales archaeon]
MVKCEHCDKEFPSYQALKQHHQSKHATLKFNIPKEKLMKPSERRIASKNRDRKIKLGIFIAVIIVSAAAIGYLAISSSLFSPSPAGGDSGPTSAWVGRQAPNFSLAEVNGSGTFTLSSYTGKVNVLLFFNEGLDCSPCLQQMQDLSNDYAKFSALNIIVVAITTDTASGLYQWAQSNQVNHLVILSDSGLTVSNSYRTLGSNVSMMSGRDGHTFILAGASGIIKWRADYGPGTMFVPDSTILNNCQNGLSTVTTESSSLARSSSSSS